MSAQLTLYVGVGAVLPALPLFAGAIGLSSKLSGIVIAAPAGAMLFAARPAGALADRGRKPAMLAGMLLIAIADAGTAMSNGATGLLCARLALGLGRAVSEAGERGMLADLANRASELRGRALAIQQAVSAAGLALGAPIGGYAIEHYGIRAAFLCVTAAAMIALALYATLPETLPPAAAGPGGTAVGRAGGATLTDKEELNKNTIAWRRLWKDQAWRSICAAEAGARVTYAAKISVVPILATRVFDGSPTAAGFVLSAAASAALFGAPCGGAAADAIGPRATATASGILAGLGLMLIPFTLTLQDTSKFAFVTAIAIWSFFVSSQGPALTSLGQLKAQLGRESTSLALPRAAGDAAFLMSPLLLGTLNDANLGPPGSDCALAGLALLLGAASLLAAPTSAYHQSSSSSSSSTNAKSQQD